MSRWILLALLALPAAAPPARAAQAPPPDWFKYDRPAEYEVIVTDIAVPTRHGDLSCDLGRPGTDGAPVDKRFPGIVVEYTPYGRKTNTAGFFDYFVERGYVGITCDVPGGGQSTNLQTFTPFTDVEREANYDLIEWLAAQPFSTGKVGQHGNSYGGMTTYRVAGMAPPHLTTITPASAFSSWYLDWNYFGGIKTGADLYQAVSMATTAGRGLIQLTTNYEHPTYDDYWLERDISNKLSGIKIPVLGIGCWNDYFSDAMTRNYMALRTRQVLIMGPEQHYCGSHGRLAWYDRYLKELPTAPPPPATVVSYELPDDPSLPGGAGRGWETLADWPPPDTKVVRTYFTADNKLAPTAGKPGTHDFAVEPFDSPFANLTAGAPNPMTATGNQGPFPEQTDLDTRRLTFTSAPLDRDVVLAGDVRVRLRAALSATEGNLVVRVHDVTPEGKSYFVTRGWLKASHWESHVTPKPLTPGETYTFPIDVWAAHWRFAKGHSIRIAVSSGDYPKIQPDAPPGTVTIHSGDSGSYADFVLRNGGSPVLGTVEQAPATPTSRTCTSRRRVRVPLRNPRRGGRIKSAVIRVDGSPTRRLRGRALRRVLRRGHLLLDLSGRPPQAVRIRVTARTTRGRTIRSTKRYRTCVNAPR